MMLDTHTRLGAGRPASHAAPQAPLLSPQVCLHSRNPHAAPLLTPVAIEGLPTRGGASLPVCRRPHPACTVTCLSTAQEQASTSPIPSTSGTTTTTSPTPSTSGTTSTEAQGGHAIYSLPQLYELAFSYRDLKQELKFLRDVYKKHAGGTQPLTSVLDLGCGPGAHASGLAAAGVAHVVGLDLNPAMLEYARSKAKDAPTGGKQPKGTVTFVQGDMRSLQPALEAGLQAPESKVAGNEPWTAADSPPQFDMVMCLLGTFSHLLTNREALAAFRGVAAVLRPGGLFVLELAHPGDLFDGTLIIGDGGKEMWEVAQGKDGKLLVEWGAEFDNFDPVSQVIDRTVSINRFQGEEVVQSVEEVVPARQFTVQEIELLADVAELEVKQLYGDMAATIGLSHEDAYRMVVVLKKPNAAAA